jgi:hypothetical protein
MPDGQRTHKHTGHKLPTTNEHHDGVMGLGWGRGVGGGGQEGPPSRGKDNNGKSTNPTAKGHGSSTTEWKMEDYHTRTPRKKARNEEGSYR